MTLHGGDFIGLNLFDKYTKKQVDERIGLMTRTFDARLEEFEAIFETAFDIHRARYEHKPKQKRAGRRKSK